MPPVASTVLRFIGLIAAGQVAFVAHQIRPGLLVACTTTSRTRLTNLRANFSRESFRGILHLVKNRNGLYRIARMKTSYPPLATGSVIASAAWSE